MSAVEGQCRTPRDFIWRPYICVFLTILGLLVDSKNSVLLDSQPRRRPKCTIIPLMPKLDHQSTVSDIEGITHTVEVTAGTLYEAVALGLSRISFGLPLVFIVVFQLFVVAVGVTWSYKSEEWPSGSVSPTGLSRK